VVVALVVMEVHGQVVLGPLVKVTRVVTAYHHQVVAVEVRVAQALTVRAVATPVAALAFQITSQAVR
jgi:hypothetical protein